MTTQTEIITPITTLSPALCAGLARILEIASRGTLQSTSDTDLLNALGEIQAAVFAAEMEYFGSNDEPLNEDDIPF